MARLLLVLPLLFAFACGHPDEPERLGRQRLLGYHVRAGADSVLPADVAGFVVTANGLGGYRIAWSGFTGLAQLFTATVTSDGPFIPSSIVGLSGRERITLTTDNAQLDVQSAPDGTVEGVDFVPLTEPIYVDLRIDGAPAPIFFTGADSGRQRQSLYDPVSFTSP